MKYSEEDYIFLYANRPCIVVGKHQNAQKEINSRFSFDNNILVARRLSGGGAVFHDEGNLNFSFIRSVAFGENISYQQITQSIFAFLNELLPSITLSERNDFLMDGNKISGSAMHVFKNRVLAHCTLLIDCNLTNLSASLQGNRNRFKDKSIESVRSKVANLSAKLQNISTEILTIDFTSYLKNKDLNISLIFLSEEDNIKISNLVAVKYSTPEWIFGYSPKYTYTHSFNFDKKIIHYTIHIEKGIIEKVSIESKDELTPDIKLQLNSLTGKHHNIHALSEWLNAPGCTPFDQSLLDSLF